jgi:hypothetical protein
MAKYLKAFVPGLLTILYAVQAAVEDGGIAADEWRNIAILAVTTALTWLVPNKPAPAPLPPPLPPKVQP